MFIAICKKNPYNKLSIKTGFKFIKFVNASLEQNITKILDGKEKCVYICFNDTDIYSETMSTLCISNYEICDTDFACASCVYTNSNGEKYPRVDNCVIYNKNDVCKIFHSSMISKIKNTENMNLIEQDFCVNHGYKICHASENIDVEKITNYIQKDNIFFNKIVLNNDFCNKFHFNRFYKKYGSVLDSCFTKGTMERHNFLDLFDLTYINAVYDYPPNYYIGEPNKKLNNLFEEIKNSQIFKFTQNGFVNVCKFKDFEKYFKFENDVGYAVIPCVTSYKYSFKLKKNDIPFENIIYPNLMISKSNVAFGCHYMLFLRVNRKSYENFNEESVFNIISFKK